MLGLLTCEDLCVKTLQSVSHNLGGHVFSSLIQSQNKLTSLCEAPCLQEGSFLLSEGKGHIVYVCVSLFYFQKHATCQYTILLLRSFKHWTKAV